MNESNASRPMPRVRLWQKCLLGALGAVGLAMLPLLIFFKARCQTFTPSSCHMAPTLLGPHLVGVCPKCGEAAYCSATHVEYPDPEGPLVICEAFHIARVTAVDPTIHGSDRFAVWKREMPRRWDLVAFRVPDPDGFDSPDDPKALSVSRVVGLPGETVVIRDGELWIDGEAIPVPRALKGLRYKMGEDLAEEQLWGTPARPARLDSDEYFVLGDFSARSRDSRIWPSGAPGHHPYAVPASYIEGVATYRYWPLSRRGSLRISVASQ